MTYPRLDSYFMLFLTVIHLSINYQTVKQSRKGHTQDTSMTKNIVIEQDKQTAHNMMKSTREKRHMSNINVKTCYDVVPLQEAEQLNFIIAKLNNNSEETTLRSNPQPGRVLILRSNKQPGLFPLLGSNSPPNRVPLLTSNS